MSYEQAFPIVGFAGLPTWSLEFDALAMQQGHTTFALLNDLTSGV